MAKLRACVDRPAQRRQRQHQNQHGLNARRRLFGQRSTPHGNALAGAPELLLLVLAVVFGQSGVERQSVVRKRVAGRRATAVERIVGGWFLIARHIKNEAGSERLIRSLYLLLPEFR